MTHPRPLLAPDDVDRARTALAGAFTVDLVHERLGPVGRAAQSRGDRAGTARALGGGDDPTATLVRLFLLGRAVPARAAREALDPLPLPSALAAGLLDGTPDGDVRAALEIRPYGENRADGDPWWVVSDLGADVRSGPLAADHVLGVGAAGLTLAQATPRDPVRRALDVGTGCGVQALHLSAHASEVVATDLSARALTMAATTAALSGRAWQLRQGSFLEPVAGDRFDLVVANPPFVLSPGVTEHEYRDSGRPGDTACRDLVRGLPGVLAPGGTAQLLANWAVPADGDWRDHVAEWVSDSGCDAWVWQREVADLGEYVTLWLRDAGHDPDSPDWTGRYDAWLDWFAAQGIVAVGMGLITLWAGGASDPVVVLEDVVQPVSQPIGSEIAAWHRRQRRLAAIDDAQLLGMPLLPAPGVVRTRDDLTTDDGWSTARQVLRQTHGMRWELEADDAIGGLVGACAAGGTPALACELLAATTGADGGAVAQAAAPVVRDLVSRGFLLFPEASA
ncbi:DUF7059 domain-containing protein [Jatrophihabitans fulvus]